VEQACGARGGLLGQGGGLDDMPVLFVDHCSWIIHYSLLCGFAIASDYLRALSDHCSSRGAQ
jgi:hypothetical protein